MSEPRYASFAELFPRIGASGRVEPEAVREAFTSILAGAWTPVQVAGFATALRMLPDSAETIAAAAAVMRRDMVRLEHDLPLVVDTCGTGGDGHGSLNLSTAAAIIVAAAGVPVAKHGNRAVSSRAGSADVLESLGIPLDLEVTASGRVLREVGITFLLAPKHHPAMRHAAQARRELGIRTIFNALGPLCNPAHATHQLLGSYADSMRDVFAQALLELGSTRAWVVHGRDGLDEVSPFVPTEVTELSGGRLTRFTVAPEDFGIAPSAPGAIDGADGAKNAAAIERILAGAAHPAADAVVLNAAAALVVALEIAPKAATDRVRELIASGTAMRMLERWRDAARQARKVTP